MSNSNNMGKKLKRLRKELDELKAKDRRFHFLVVSPGETEEEKLKQLMALAALNRGKWTDTAGVLSPRKVLKTLPS